MTCRRHPLAAILVLMALVLFRPADSSGREVDEPPVANPVWAALDREDLLRYARATWHSFEAMTGPDGLPADRLEQSGPATWKPSRQTSPTDIAAYLWSVLAARSLALIDDRAADLRLAATLDSLGTMERHHGFFHNSYDVTTRARLGVGGDKTHPARPFLSTVDNGWLAAALMMVGNTRPALRDQTETLLAPMDFGFFYEPWNPDDPIHHPGQFHGGYYSDDRSFTATYGMLNAEPRIVTYLAIARHQVPPEHYFRLYRTLPTDHGRQAQVPQGVTRTYQRVPVFEGHYAYLGFDFVPSWGGSMFEALMVPLFVPEERWSPASWGRNHPNYVRIQIEQGLEKMRYGFWGFSPSATPEGGYQTYGVPELGTEVGGYFSYETPTALRENSRSTAKASLRGVVTPHASFLALRYAPEAALANLRALNRSFPILDEQGFHDSVDVTTGKVSQNVLSLDQGMILAAIANALADDATRRAFSAGAIEAAIRPLIAPEEFSITEKRRP